MAMVVQHNAAAQLALGELNKNTTKVGKLLGKVSSGQKINSAQDDASGYVISERMREMIRTLNQDHQNVQNGSSLFKIAEGGINSIVEELRNLKELAINSANDTNTDVDRLTIQKAFDQKKANINDIATETNYNSMILLDGRFANSATTVIKGGQKTGSTGASTDNSLTSKFTPLPGTEFWQPYINATNNPVSPHWVSGGRYPVTKSFQGAGYGISQVYVEFPNYHITSSVANLLDGRGFSIACGTCSQYVAIKFDKSINVSDSQLGTGVNNEPEYTIGIKDVRSMKDLPKAIFEGVGTARSESIGPNDTVTIDNSGHQITMYRDARNGKYVIQKNVNPLQFYGEVYGSMPMPALPSEDEEPDQVILGVRAPLVIHHGPHANQATNFFINDMHTKSLGTKELIKGNLPTNDSDLARFDALGYDEDLKEAWMETLSLAQNKNLDDVDVITKKNANVAIRVIDGAIEYALNEATRIGSYLQRLDHTGSNLVVMNENVQAAESAIRDADMAKEMTEYTKFNVLSQSAQAMLAQANQNSSAVLSLLQ